MNSPAAKASSRIGARARIQRAGRRLRRVWRPQPIGRNRFLQGLVVVYGLIFLWSALNPVDRSAWVLENVLVVGTLALLAATHGRFRFSNLSWFSIFCFFALHAVGSHYTYSLTPIGEFFGGSRNHYDRFVHFAFGLLIAYPLREVARRVLHLRPPWAYAVPLLTILSLSAGYEIIESWAARIAAPELGGAFVGAQGDEWDAQKDMSLATLGALITFVATEAYRRRRGREPWDLLDPEVS